MFKAKINGSQQSSKYSFYEERGEVVNHMISEGCKLAQKEYKTRHDWAENVTRWELRKRLKFYRSTKSYMHKPESVLENETHKNLCDFEIQKSPNSSLKTKLRVNN